MKEYGGYLDFERFYGSEYHNNIKRFNNARNALIFVILVRKYKKLYIPELLCDCIENVLRKNGIKYEKYRVNENYRGCFENIDFLDNEEAILLINYFGVLSKNEIISMYKKYNNIIVDNTQAFFDLPVRKIDTIYSCRKYFGVTDGGYCYCSDGDELYENLITDNSTSRFLHLLGRYSTSAEEYYNYFLQNEKIIDDMTIGKMSVLTQNILKGIDYDFVIRRRKINFQTLHNILKNINLLCDVGENGLFMYPIRVSNAENIRKKLILHKIYTPIMWKDLLEKPSINFSTREIVMNTILLPIDQRYDKSDMEYIGNTFLNIYNKFNQGG